MYLVGTGAHSTGQAWQVVHAVSAVRASWQLIQLAIDVTLVVIVISSSRETSP